MSRIDRFCRWMVTPKPVWGYLSAILYAAILYAALFVLIWHLSCNAQQPIGFSVDTSYGRYLTEITTFDTTWVYPVEPVHNNNWPNEHESIHGVTTITSLFTVDTTIECWYVHWTDPMIRIRVDDLDSIPCPEFPYPVCRLDCDTTLDTTVAGMWIVGDWFHTGEMDSIWISPGLVPHLGDMVNPWFDAWNPCVYCPTYSPTDRVKP